MNPLLSKVREGFEGSGRLFSSLYTETESVTLILYNSGNLHTKLKDTEGVACYQPHLRWLLRSLTTWGWEKVFSVTLVCSLQTQRDLKLNMAVDGQIQSYMFVGKVT
jgi:hypothetical protein